VYAQLREAFDILRHDQAAIYFIFVGHPGNVPPSLSSKNPGHNISNGWLDALDPLFHSIATKTMQQMGAAFGKGAFYEADGWFDSQTGPWLSASSSSSSSASSASSASSDSQPTIGHTTAAILEDSGSWCIGGFTIPSFDEGRAHASAVAAAILNGNDTSVRWVYQGYPWSRISADATKGCDMQALYSYIQGFVSGVPKDENGVSRLLVLDLIADAVPPPFNDGDWTLWNQRNGSTDASGTALLAGAPSIWCALQNWVGGSFGAFTSAVSDTLLLSLCVSSSSLRRLLR
jgi:hypothetical protein